MTQACIFLPVAACTQLDTELEVLLWQGGTGRRLPLARALEEAGGSEVGSLAGVGNEVDLEDSLAAADFDLFAGTEDGTIRKLS